MPKKSVLRIEDVSFDVNQKPPGKWFASFPVISRTTARGPSVALYPRTVAIGKLKITVTVTRLDPTVQHAWIRATGGVAAVGGSARVIGQVQETAVTFGGRDTVEVIADVDQTLKTAVVATHTVRWQWLARTTRSSPFRAINQTTHEVFTSIGAPVRPWGRQPSPIHDVPWREVLQYACAWAKGAKTSREVKALITKAVHRLRVLIYDKDSSGYVGPEQPIPSWPCIDFVTFLATGLGINRVNCTDVATIACTFANILGADAFEDQMDVHAPTAPVRGIGSRTFAPLRDLNYHEVVWDAPGQEPQHVWDAALMLRAGGRNVEAIDIPFRGYRDRLMGSSDPLKCSPNPNPSKRRAAHREPEPGWHLPIDRVELRHWRFHSSVAERVSPVLRVTRSLWLGEEDPDHLRLTIDVTEIIGDRSPELVMEDFVVSETGGKAFEPIDGIGEQALANLAQTIIYFRREKRIVRLRSGGLTAMTVRAQAEVMAIAVSTL